MAKQKNTQKNKTHYLIEYEGKAFWKITKYSLQGEKLAKYTIDMREKTCGCKHYQIHRTECKHIRMCQQERT